ELRFRTLYLQIQDYAQQLSAAQAALSLAQKEYDAAAVKFSLGTLSPNGLADAKDAVDDADDAVDNAARNLFSSYNNYRWAVRYGILN
ncbi:MAG: TolC family protein, partial [Oscillospiraceae bacterium]|nr:TolC family protein [Oscillospiraceae bacterium]